MSAPLDLATLHGEVCRCGCGHPAPLAQRTNARLGHRRGHPLTYLPGHNRRGSTDLTRYTVLPSGCWRWDGPLNHKGYGRTHVNGEHTGAHRAVFESIHGELPRTVQLDHRCEYRACVNPACMQLASNAENNRRKATTILTVALVEEIRASTDTDTALARRLGVARQTVNDVRHGRRWVSALNPAASAA